MTKKYTNEDISLQLAIKQAITKSAASFGEFADVDTEERSSEVMKMASEMAALSKYQEIKDKIRNASGIVNFVTSDQYQPLVERILQVAIPPSQNDVYHMGVDFVIPGDYDVDAKQYFGKAGADARTQYAAIKSLENLLLGAPVKMTPEWFYDLGWNDTKLGEYFGKEAWPIIKRGFEMLKVKDAELGRSGIKKDMANAHKKIVDAYQDLKYNELVAKRNEENKGKPNYTPLVERQVLEHAQIDKLKRSFEVYRNSFLAKRANLPHEVHQALLQELQERLMQQAGGNTAAVQAAAQQAAAVAGRFLALALGSEEGHSFSKKIERSNNGFVDWNPASDFRSLFNNILEKREEIATERGRTATIDPAKREELATILASFMNKLKAYSSGDREVVALKQDITELIGDASTSNSVVLVENFFKNRSQFSQKVRELLNKVKNHGSVIIFSNVDDSVLTSLQMSNPDDQRTVSAINSIMREFNSKMEATESRVQEQSSVAAGRKLLVLISNKPIRSLYSGATVIEMEDYPVDSEEAKIIVDNLLESEFGKTYREIKLFNGESAIEQKYNALEKKGGYTKQMGQQQEDEIDLLHATINATLKTSLPNDDAIEEVREMIVGLGQNQAIHIVKNTIRNAMAYDKDESGSSIVKLDGNKWVASTIVASNKQHNEDVPGLSTRRSKVKFDDYIFAKTSSDPTDLGPLKWGDMVGSYGQKHREYMAIQMRIQSIDNDLIECDSQLASPKASQESKIDLEVKKANLLAMREDLVEKRGTYIRTLPHFVILYGKPGVGKTVWADALADLFGFVIRQVDFDNAKDMWYGNTEKYTTRIINVLKTCRNTVILIDELDRGVEMSGDRPGGQHPVDGGIVKKLLQFFEDNYADLVEHNVFAVVTTNNINKFDKALSNRTKGNKYEVQSPNDPDDYNKYLETFLRTEKADTPKSPWLTEIGDYIEQRNKTGMLGSAKEVAGELSGLGHKRVTIEDYWTELDKLIRSVDVNQLCKILAERQLGFRTLSGLLRKAVLMHNTYLIQKKQMARGETTEIMGIPFTTENLCRAASLAVDGSDNPGDDTDGVSEVAAEMKSRVNPKLKSMKMELKDKIEILPPHKYKPEQILEMLRNGQAVIAKLGLFEGLNELADVCLVEAATKQPKRDPVTKRIDPASRIARVQLDSNNQIIKGYSLPSGIDLDKEMSYSPVAPSANTSSWNVEDQIIGDPNDPNARRVPRIKRKPLDQPAVGQPMDKLVDDGMQDVTVQPEAPEVTPETGQVTKENDESKKKETVKKSTTDYYYEFLKSSGVLDKKAQVAVQQPSTGVAEPQWFDDVEKYGVYYYHGGQLFIGPAGPDEEAQYLSSTKGRR